MRKVKVWWVKVKCPKCGFKTDWCYNQKDFPEGMRKEWNDSHFREQYEPYCVDCGDYGEWVLVDLIEEKPGYITKD